MKNIFFVLLFGALLASCTNEFPFFASNPQPTYAPVQRTEVRTTTSTAYVPRNSLAANNPEGMPAAPTRLAQSNIGSGGMDSNDRNKMSHALDNPIGKSTTWVNSSSGYSYTVTPVKKVTVGGNAFCRSFTTSVAKGTQTRVTTGTACVDSNGTWQMNT